MENIFEVLRSPGASKESAQTELLTVLEKDLETSSAFPQLSKLKKLKQESPIDDEEPADISDEDEKPGILPQMSDLSEANVNAMFAFNDEAIGGVDESGAGVEGSFCGEVVKKASTRHRHRCNLCSFGSERQDSLKVHIWKEHRELRLSEANAESLDKPWQQPRRSFRPSRCFNCGQTVTSSGEAKHACPEDAMDPKRMLPGRVKCLLCGSVVVKTAARQHAKSHLGFPPWQCRRCPFACYHKKSLQTHLWSGHREESLTEENSQVASEALGGPALQELKARCFGSLRDVSDAIVHCGKCGVAVHLATRRNHLSVVHLKETISACRICSYTTSYFPLNHIYAHLRKKHGQEPTKENFVSKCNYFKPILQQLSLEYFGL